MMEAPDGITMSKTKGNGINLSDSENNMFGKAMSYPDNLIIKGLNLLTDVPTKKIFEIENALNQGQNPMQFKKIMAFFSTNAIISLCNVYERAASLHHQREQEDAPGKFEKVQSLVIVP